MTRTENYAEFCQSLNSALQLQGLALLCTAIVETIERQLTLFHALCVLHLLSLLGFGLVAQRKYHGGGLKRWLVLAFLRIVIAGAFVALTTYIWITAPTFGSQPECNADTVSRCGHKFQPGQVNISDFAQKYVVFGVSINATNDIFRYVLLALMAAMAVGWVLNMVFTVFFASCCCGGARSSARRIHDSSPDVAVLKNVLMRIKVSDPRYKGNVVSGQIIELLIHTGINIYMSKSTTVTGIIRDEILLPLKDPNADKQCSLQVVTLEQMVHVNNLSPEEKDWTFGQILALFVLLGVVVEVINILLNKLDGPSHTQRDSDVDGDIELSNTVMSVVGGRRDRLLGPGTSV